MPRTLVIGAIMLLSLPSHAADSLSSAMLAMIDIRVNGCIESFPNEKDAFLSARDKALPAVDESERQSPGYIFMYQPGYDEFMKGDVATRRKQCDDVLGRH